MFRCCIFVDKFVWLRFFPVQPNSKKKAKSRRLVPTRPRTSLYFKCTATEFRGLSLKSSRVVAVNRVQQPITRQHSLALSSPEIDERVVASLLIATRLTKSIHHLLLLQSREMLDFPMISRGLFWGGIFLLCRCCRRLLNVRNILKVFTCTVFVFSNRNLTLYGRQEGGLLLDKHGTVKESTSLPIC